MSTLRYKNPILDVGELTEWMQEGSVILFDCRFYLEEPERGKNEFCDNHIPGARYLHLKTDLSRPIGDGSEGRHPLPEMETLWKKLTAFGVSETSKIVCYDSAGGPFAARLWWLLRWSGFTNVWVLNGGWAAWETYNSTPEHRFEPSTRNPRPSNAGTKVDDISQNSTRSSEAIVLTTSIEDLPIRTIAQSFESNSARSNLVDSRTHDRFLGQNETIDPIAGHIPGAINLPWTDNLDEFGHFLEPDRLHSRFKTLFGEQSNPVFYCGSGVTACHNILATQIAGLPLPELYAESWSGWISKPDRPVALGEP